jgi:RNA polymerase sigma factor (sigma-70 family)
VGKKANKAVLPGCPPLAQTGSQAPMREGFKFKSSLSLLRHAQAGDKSALSALFARQIPALRRWARGRLPHWARQMGDTADIVQEALARTFRRIDKFEYQRQEALQAYLRRAVTNQIRDEVRRVQREPAPAPLEENQVDEAPSPLDAAMGTSVADAYRRALLTLREEEREAVVARLELGYSYAQIAVMLDKPSADAARMMVTRAMATLAEHMAAHAE